jgi:hypothetical protein
MIGDRACQFFCQSWIANQGNQALLNPAMIFSLGGALRAPPKLKIIATISNAPFLKHILAIAPPLTTLTLHDLNP